METRDRHLLHAVLDLPWAILPAKLTDIVALLHLHAAGVRLSEPDIRARIGSEPPVPRRAQTSGEVRVIPVFGVLARRMDLVTQSSGGTSTDTLAASVREAIDDPSVRTLALVVDSPGGTVMGTPELSATIRRARDQKRVVAIIDGLAASAGYWIASQASEVVITPSGECGSIGVIAAHDCVAGALEKAGITTTLITAGTHKAQGNPFEPLTSDARATMQRRVDVAYGQFVADVAAGRGIGDAAVRTGYGQGRVLAAEDALAAGMVDEIAPLDAVLSRVQQRGGAQTSRALGARSVTGTELQSSDDPLWWYRRQLELLEL